MEFKNHVFTGEYKYGNLKDEYPATHNPAPPFKGRKFYQPGAKKAGQPTALYKAYLKQNYPKSNVEIPDNLGDVVLTNKGTFIDKDKLRDRRYKEFKLKSSRGGEMSKRGIYNKNKPSQTVSFNINTDDSKYDQEVRDYLKGKKGKFLVRWEGGSFELNLIGSWKNGDRLSYESGIMVGSATTYFDEENKISKRKNWTIEVLRFSELPFKPQQNNKPIYADNDTGTCIIDPIINYYKQNPNSFSEKKNLVNKLEKRAKKFPNGVTPDEIQTLCNTYELAVRIYNILGQEIVNCKPTYREARKVFNYVNTRQNHAECWNHCDFFDTERETVELETSQEMSEKYDELVKNGEEFTFKKTKRIQGKDKINYINTKTIHYELKDPLQSLEREFYKKNPIPHLEDEIIFDEEGNNIHKGVGKFINSATYVNGIHDFNRYTEDEEIIEHDVNKAYATFKECKYYDHYKFPGVPTDFRNVSDEDIDLIINKTGWTQICNIKGQGNAFELADLKEYGVYPNVELKCLKDLGVKFNIVVSAWSTETIDINFDDILLQSIDHPDYIGQKPYAIICGKMLGYTEKQTTNYKYVEKPSDTFINEISYYNPDMKKVWDNEDEEYMIIVKNKKTVKHRNHVGGYVTAYVRCRMYEEIEKYKREDLWFVRSDAIKHKGNYALPDGFKVKKDDIKLHEYNDGIMSMEDFIENKTTAFKNNKYIIDDWDCGSFIDHDKIIKYMGAGGTGKTHSFIHDKGLCYKAIAFPTNELKEDFDFKNKFTHHATGGLICGGDQRANTQEFEKKAIGNLFIDEITMRNKQDVKDLLKIKCPRLIFAGDWDEDTGMVYQLKPVKDEFPYELLKPYKSIYFTKNYRIQDPKLNTIINNIRKIMKKNYGKTNVATLNNHIINTYLSDKVIPEDDIYEKYIIDDLCICSMNKNQKRINEEFDKKGVMNSGEALDKYTKTLTKKWKITAKTNEYPNGKFVRGNIKTKNKELAFATTIHAVQGKTWKNKLFIDIDNMFEWGMLYTAVSRLTKLDDLYLLGD